MIDRNARNQMAAAIRDYMEDRTTSFKLADLLWDTAHSTKDETVKAVAEFMWGHYDDLKDHKIVASKQQWDYFNRLLLLIDSEAEVEDTKWHWTWSFSQALAAPFLAGFVFVGFKYGIGRTFFVYWLVSSAVSMVLFWLTLRRTGKLSSATIAITPFPSIASLLFIRRRVPGFARKRYPQEISGRRIRHWFAEKTMWLQSWLFLLLFSPLALVFLMLPDREFETPIRMPEPKET